MENATTRPQPWIHSAGQDLSLVLLPPVVISIITFFCLSLTSSADQGVLSLRILGMIWLVAQWADAGHVWATLVRTHLVFGSDRFKKSTYVVIAVGIWAATQILYAVTGTRVFWFIYQILSVFHLVRQQYGFVSIYRRLDPRPSREVSRRLDALAVYGATLLPYAWAGSHRKKNVYWFLENDLLNLSGLSVLSHLILFCSIALCAAYVSKEIRFFLRTRFFNWPKNLVIFGTAFGWSVSLTFFDMRIAFLPLSVFHSLPYVGLIYLYAVRNKKADRFILGKYANLILLALLFSVVLGIGYFVSPLVSSLLNLDDSSANSLRFWLIPLLLTPTIFHYLIDGFIWRIRRPDQGLQQLLEDQRQSAA